MAATSIEMIGFITSSHFKEIIFVRVFGFPWWWAPWWGWNWGYYPYGAYGYSEYSYPSSTPATDMSMVTMAMVMGRPAMVTNIATHMGVTTGSYYSGTNYENDDESAVRNVLAEYAVAWNRHDMAAFGRLFTENCDYVNVAGVHWKGVQEIVQRQRNCFRTD
jgi:hypothetical protein